MSCERKVKTFEEVEDVRIEYCNKKEIESLENSIISAIEQKIEKLNILIKNCDIYNYSDCLLINDRYNICSGLEEVAVAFGLNIKKIECSLRGKNYIITDELVRVLKQFDKTYFFGENIKSLDLTETIMNIIDKYKTKDYIDQEILEMVRNIKTNGQFVTTRTRTITEVSEDQFLVERSIGEWISNADEAKNKLMEISKNAQSIVNNANNQLRDGTAKLIYARARQMGYAVQEIKKGTQTQLVLVRCE